MHPRLRFDVAILTVIPVELRAVQQALKIDSKNRLHVDGGIYFQTTINSRIMDRDIRVIVGCVGAPSQANAAVMTMAIIKEFDPTLIMLMGICAGMRDKVKIGDVVVPRDIVDLSVTVAVPGGVKTRQANKTLPFAVKQMLNAFELDIAAHEDRCRELFGVPNVPVGQEADFIKHVTFKPRVVDNAVASADVLLKDPDAFARLIEKNDSIRAAEMEAGGFVKACESVLSPRLWLVVRGVSDFGDTFKNDDFHRLASCAAAAWVTLFLEHGLDLPRNDGVGAPTAPVDVTTPTPTGIGFLGPVATELINFQLEKLGRVLTEDRQKELEAIRNEWREGHDATILVRIEAMKQRDDWRLVAADVRAKLLRFEASLVLSVDRGVAKARELADEAVRLDPAANTEVLRGLIEYHESGLQHALQLLSEPRTLDGWNLRLALLGETGEWPAVLAEFARIPPSFTPNAETKRLRALALTFCGRLDDARTEIGVALTESPNWFTVRYAAAIIDYFASLSPALIPHASKGWPAPIDTTMVRTDATALAALRRAEAVFTDLLKANATDITTRRVIEGWRLASLANHLERKDEAQRYCAELLTRDCRNPIALAWASARGYKMDLRAGIDALFAEVCGQNP